MVYLEVFQNFKLVEMFKSLYDVSYSTGNGPSITCTNKSSGGGKLQATVGELGAVQQVSFVYSDSCLVGAGVRASGKDAGKAVQAVAKALRFVLGQNFWLRYIQAVLGWVKGLPITSLRLVSILISVLHCHILLGLMGCDCGIDCLYCIMAKSVNWNQPSLMHNFISSGPLR